MSQGTDRTPTERIALNDLDGEPHARAFPDAEPKTVRLSLDAGDSVPEHDHPGRQVLVYVVEGQISLELDGEPHDATAGDLVRFDGDQPIRPVAEEPSVAIVVLAADPA